MHIHTHTHTHTHTVRLWPMKRQCHEDDYRSDDDNADDGERTVDTSPPAGISDSSLERPLSFPRFCRDDKVRGADAGLQVVHDDFPVLGERQECGDPPEHGEHEAEAEEDHLAVDGRDACHGWMVEVWEGPEGGRVGVVRSEVRSEEVAWELADGHH